MFLFIYFGGAFTTTPEHRITPSATGLLEVDYTP